MKVQGAECECVGCGLIFTALSPFDAHVNGNKKRGIEPHADPAALGFVARNRRGGVVWGAPGADRPENPRWRGAQGTVAP